MEIPLWEIKRELLVKADEMTDQSFGNLPMSRPIRDYIKYGVVNLDKPAGPTSHEVSAWVKRILKIEHAGHGGTLDPGVTGILPIALEEATKIVQVLLLSGKEYVCVMRLHASVPSEKVITVMNEFVGDILQRPPLRSSVRRSIRTRRIYYIDDLEFKSNWVLFRIGCQAGTYIRKICFDIGEALGCGAHMEELRRTRTGPFTENQNLVSLYDLYDAYDQWISKNDETYLRQVIKPMEEASALLPRIQIRDSAVDAICHGANLAVPGVLSLDSGIRKRTIVGIYTLKGELVALARALMSTEDILAKEHGLAADTLRVVMTIGTYPKMWQSNNKSDGKTE
ncbi:MAG: ribonucleoprotein complex subunit 4 [Thermoproteota archaeon]|nr:ribonucleoprotein complex subunit 4 [Thermoproteota archaeon]